MAQKDELKQTHKDPDNTPEYFKHLLKNVTGSKKYNVITEVKLY